MGSQISVELNHRSDRIKLVFEKQYSRNAENKNNSKKGKENQLVKYPVFQFRLPFEVETNIDIGLNTMNYVVV